MSYPKYSYLLFFLFFVTLGYSQIERPNFNVNMSGYLAVDEDLPFWLTSNTFGAVENSTNYLLAVDGETSYKFTEHSYLVVKASLFLHDGSVDTFQRDELFLEYNNKWIQATFGAKHIETRFDNLSISRNNFLQSGNNRSLPGIQIQSPKPLKLFKAVDFEYGLGHFEMNDDRYVDETMVHFKKLGVNVHLSDRVFIVAQLHHYAMWGGISPEEGKLPDSFSDFIDVFLGRSGEGEEQNSLGNHLGLYNLELHYTTKRGSYTFYHQHPFEDGSGSALKNFPDGIWGIYAAHNNVDYSSVFKGIVLEYIQTTSQSGGDGASGRDNYFHNNLYKSGWTYEGNVIGMPLIQIGENSRIKGANFGILFGVKKVDVLFKTTYTRNYGTYFTPYSPKEDDLYSILNTTYSFEKFGKLACQIGFDYRSERKDRFGGGLTYSYTF